MKDFDITSSGNASCCVSLYFLYCPSKHNDFNYLMMAPRAETCSIIISQRIHLQM
jgi:hypothetical protein